MCVTLCYMCVITAFDSQVCASNITKSDGGRMEKSDYCTQIPWYKQSEMLFGCQIHRNICRLDENSVTVVLTLCVSNPAILCKSFITNSCT
jgi:hypothetical protein